jgi:hypothetical protein
MRRVGGAAVVVTLLLMAGVRPDPAGAVPFDCCVCTGCPVGPADCTLQAISCDITCTNLGCTGFSGEVGAICETLPMCSDRGPTSSAPAVGGIGIALVATLLAGFGVFRLARRRS